MPYAAFDLEVSYPIYRNGTKNYFPIRRATNMSKYALGRAFLQEAYIGVDYESTSFSIHQALPQSDIPDPDIIPNHPGTH